MLDLFLQGGQGGVDRLLGAGDLTALAGGVLVDDLFLPVQEKQQGRVLQGGHLRALALGAALHQHHGSDIRDVPGVQGDPGLEIPPQVAGEEDVDGFHLMALGQLPPLQGGLGVGLGRGEGVGVEFGAAAGGLGPGPG